MRQHATTVGINYSWSDERQNTLLTRIALCGILPADLAILLQDKTLQGMINTINARGETALHIFSRTPGDAVDQVRLLLANKAHPSKDSNYDDFYTPLQLAARHGNYNIACSLIELGAPIESLQAMQPHDQDEATDIIAMLLKYQEDSLDKTGQNQASGKHAVARASMARQSVVTTAALLNSTQQGGSAGGAAGACGKSLN